MPTWPPISFVILSFSCTESDCHRHNAHSLSDIPLSHMKFNKNISQLTQLLFFPVLNFHLIFNSLILLLWEKWCLIRKCRLRIGIPRYLWILKNRCMLSGMECIASVLGGLNGMKLFVRTVPSEGEYRHFPTHFLYKSKPLQT